MAEIEQDKPVGYNAATVPLHLTSTTVISLSGYNPLTEAPFVKSSSLDMCEPTLALFPYCRGLAATTTAASR